MRIMQNIIQSVGSYIRITSLNLWNTIQLITIYARNSCFRVSTTVSCTSGKTNSLQNWFYSNHIALTWFKSYLSGRFQTFQVSGVMSEPVAVDCSVPQSSVLGLVKFISYTEDVTSVFKKHGVRHQLYADDKQGYMDVPISNIATARTTLQDCVSDVSNWCSSRRLQLNTGKPSLSGLAWDRV